MVDINKYIGISYKSKGYDFNGLDCYGLVWLFSKLEMGVDLPKFEQFDPYEDRAEVARQMDLNVPLLTGFKTDNPKFGDVVVFKFMGISGHFGIYIENNCVLHILKGTDSTYESFTKGRLKGRLDGIYRLKE